MPAKCLGCGGTVMPFRRAMFHLKRKATCASCGKTVRLWAGFMPLIVAQVALFGVLWWYNAKRVNAREREWAAKREEAHGFT